MNQPIPRRSGGAQPPIELRHRLRIAREYAGLEQEQLADVMEVGRSTVSNAELGKVEPRRMTVNAWALATGVSVDWLRGRPVPDPPPGCDIRTTDYKQPHRKTG